MGEASDVLCDANALKRRTIFGHAQHRIEATDMSQDANKPGEDRAELLHLIRLEGRAARGSASEEAGDRRGRFFPRG